jgi:glycosyltransferase involved in cell wall biosynthesis
VFVLPSQNENFGNTAAEAAIVGTPLIVTENCGVAPLLANVAGLVVQHDVAFLSEAMERILGDVQFAAELSAGGRSLAAQLDWEKPASEMEALYDGTARRDRKCSAPACAR